MKNQKHLHRSLVSLNDLIRHPQFAESSCQNQILIKFETLSSEDQLDVQIQLTKEVGLQASNAASLNKFFVNSGKSSKENLDIAYDTVAQFANQNHMLFNSRKVLDQASKVSGQLLMSFKGSTKELINAVLQANKLGISLEQADKISESLLDFESSIENQISAELITGKQLNMEKARLLALNGKSAEAAAEILKQVGGTAEFTKMNRIQQEALAKAVGMTRDDLAKSLVDREAAVKLGAKEGQSAQDRYNELVKQYGVEKANAMLGDEKLANQFEQQSVQERFTQSIEKLKEVFVSLAEPLMPVLDTFSEIFTMIGPIVEVVAKIVNFTMHWGKYLLPIIAAYKAFQITSGVVLAIQAAYNNEKALEYLMTKKNLIAKVGEKTYNYASLLIEKAKNSTLLKNLFLKKEENAIAKKSLLKSIGDAVMQTVKGLAGLGPIGWILGLVAAGTVAALGYKYMKGDDVMSEGGYGNRTLLTPKGSIALNNSDTVIAGTNLGGGKGNTSSAPQQDNSALIAEMRAMRQEQARANSKPTVVENSMNGTKFGTSVAMNTYKIQ